jgi:hypothetical protein
MRVSDEQTWPESARQCLGRGAEIHVVEDDGCGLAAELEGAARDAFAAQRRDAATRRRRAGEGDLVDAWIANQELGHLAVGRHDVEHTGGQADLLGRLGEDVALARRLG